MVSSHEAEEAEPIINEISEEKIDRVLSLLHEADPTSPETDAVELPGASQNSHGIWTRKFNRVLAKKNSWNQINQFHEKKFF